MDYSEPGLIIDDTPDSGIPSRPESRTDISMESRRGSSVPEHRRLPSNDTDRPDVSTYMRAAKISDPDEKNRCLGVFGLSYETCQKDLYDHFNKFGQVDHVHLIVDSRSRVSKGFGFVTFKTHDDA